MADLDITAGPSNPSVESDTDVLRRRADSLSRETEAEDDSENRLALLLFRIAEEWYAVPASDVREIFQEYAITSIPCVPNHILGVVNVRGEILSVTDPAALMHLGSVDMGGDVMPPAIVITNETVATALVVDEIGDITEVPREAVEPAISIIDRAQAEYVAGSVYVNGTMLGLVSIERMLEPVVTAGRH